MNQRAPIYRQVLDLFKQDGRIRPGTGMITGVIALFLAILSVLGVLAFHFPAYLTTPELRSFYTVEAMRTLLFAALLASGTIALTNIVFLWRIHAVHHSTRTLDWLAGSRLHIVELLITRVAVLGVLFALGFSKPVLDAYIIIVGFQAVLIHSNVKLPWGWLRYVIVTPDFHHWHHSSDTEAIDRNYAAHLSFIDYLFGTAVRGTGKRLPQNYGILDNDMPGTFLAQQAYPFRKR